MGEPAGIGAEITVKAWCNRDVSAGRPWVYLGDPDLLRMSADTVGADVIVREAPDAAGASRIWPDALPVLPVPLAKAVVFGAPDTANAPATIASIDRAVALAEAGDAAGVVTNPIQKSTLYDAGFRHPGHTEYLTHITGADGPAVMMLVAAGLRTVPVTIHIPLSRVAEALDTDLIVRTVTIVDRDLRTRFAIERPRIAVAGLNPHAGEGGSIGTEDADIIAPAIARLRDADIDVFGPLPADTMFHDTARETYDAAVCMYHDQALIPVKTIGFDTGVNCTLGLPIIRTSPDHGTALDIAGTGVASSASLEAALALAAELAQNDTTRA